MTKIIFLGDTHLGARNGSNHFVEYFNSFFRDQLYPYMKEHGITTIFQAGDLFDNRTQLHLKAYHASKPEWFDPLIENGWTMHALIGNHDITMRESLHINTPNSVMQEYIKAGALKLYDAPTQVKIDKNCTIDMIPWICNSNKEEVRKFIERKKISDLCFGHFEIAGAEMYRGMPGHGGLNSDIFARYEATLSGHFHTRSFMPENRINYLGTPYEMTWMDCNDSRGFTVFDTETRLYEFVKNPNAMFIKVHYNDGCSVDLNTLTGKFVKLIVERKTNLFAFDTFLNNLKMLDPYDLSIMDVVEEVGNVEVDENIEIEDTNQIISNYIDGLTTDIDKTKIKSYMQGLYVEAVNE
jgi:DNA repair exonuclease SbcCD nuclease subunit